MRQGFTAVLKLECVSFPPSDIGSNNCGYYELQAVLTHQGRSSSSGHYVSWVKRKQGTEGTLEKGVGHPSSL